MDFDDMSNYLSAKGAQNQDLAYRRKKRKLESQERKYLGTLSLAYGFDVFVYVASALALLPGAGSSPGSAWGLICVLTVISVFLVYLIFRVWRNPAPPMALVVVPAGVLLLFAAPSMNLMLFVPNMIALICGFSLGKIWSDLAALAASVSTPEG